MWKTSWTSVSPSATSRPAPVPRRRECPTTTQVHWRAAGCHGPPHGGRRFGRQHQPNHLLDEPEPRLEDVLGDHRGAVGNRSQGNRHRLQVGGNPGNGSVATLQALGRSYCTTRKPLSCWVTVCPRVMEFVQNQLQVGRIHPVTAMSPRVIAAAIPQVAATMRSPITRCSVGCSLSTPVIVKVGCRRPRSGTHLVEHHAQIDDVGFAGSVVNGGDALGDNGSHQDVLGGAHRRKLQLYVGSPQVLRRGDHTAVFDGALGPNWRNPDWCMSSGREPIASPRQCHSGAFAAADQRAEHTHRRPELANRGKIGLVLGLVREVIRTTVPSSSTLAPRPAAPRPSTARRGCPGYW